MLLLDQCDEPPQDQLAVYNPSANLERYRNDVNDAFGYRQSERSRARRTGNVALIGMSGTILNELGEHAAFVRARKHQENCIIVRSWR
jgi:hypothetical protein